MNNLIENLKLKIKNILPEEILLNTLNVINTGYTHPAISENKKQSEKKVDEFSEQ